MRFAKGKSAELSDDAAVLTWEQVAQRTKELLHSGSYAPQIILNQAIPNERLEVAQKLWYLHQDCNGEYFLDEELFRSGFPDSTERIAELLEDRAFVSDTLQGLGDFVMRYEEDRSILRFHFHRPEELLRRLAELENRQVHLPVSTVERFRDNVDFITEDEIDHYFMGGGSYSDGVLSTYSFFIHDHTSAEKAQFLKERYGIGGSSHALCGADKSHADFDGKGILLARGNYGDKDAPSVLLKWPQSAGRVEKLILTGRYLKEQHCEFDGVETVLREDGKYCCVPVTHKATLGEIVDLLQEFKAQPINLMMPKCPDGSFQEAVQPVSDVSVQRKVQARPENELRHPGQLYRTGAYPGLRSGEHQHQQTRHHQGAALAQLPVGAVHRCPRSRTDSGAEHSYRGNRGI